MSITAWGETVKNLVECDEMRALSDEEVFAVVDVLALTIHADSRVSPVEVAGFNHLFFDLEWLGERHELIRNHVPKAAESAAVDGDGKKGMAFAAGAAEKLTTPVLRERVYRLAVSLASVDMKAKPADNIALAWIGKAFGFDDATRAKLNEKW